MSKGERKSNREVRKPKKDTSKKASGGTPAYMSTEIRKPVTVGPKPKK